MSTVCMMGAMEQAPSKRIALVMPADELAALDAYCADLRRATGELIERSGVIRRAIKALLSVPVAPQE